MFLRINMSEQLRVRESVSDVSQSLAGDLMPLLTRERFEDLDGFRAWLRRAALNKIVTKYRFHAAQKRGGGERAVVSPSEAEQLDLVRSLRALPSPSEAAMGHERCERLRKAMQQLPKDQRDVVSMKQLCGMSHQEIAGVLDRSETACRMLLQRGLRRLARELEARGGRA